MRWHPGGALAAAYPTSEAAAMNPGRLPTPALLPALLLVAASLLAGPAWAEPHGMVTTPLLRTPLSGDPTREAFMGIAEFAPGGFTGRHTHPGDEFATVLEGTLELRADGREPRRVGRGDTYHNPRGLVHDTRNMGIGPARVVSTFIIDAGKPLMQPAE